MGIGSINTYGFIHLLTRGLLSLQIFHHLLVGIGVGVENHQCISRILLAIGKKNKKSSKAKLVKSICAKLARYFLTETKLLSPCFLPMTKNTSGNLNFRMIAREYFNLLDSQ